MSKDALLHHGTQAFQLSPSSIVAAARADMRRRQENKAAHEIKGPMQRYAFHKKHVRDAANEGELIKRALDDRMRGQESNKRSTVILYSNADALIAALNNLYAEGTPA